jgi:AcrR family transcriptional regulator
MTIEAIAKKANVSVPSVYAIFKSKTGILTALLDESMFGSDYEEIVRYAQSATDPETRLRRAAAVARQIRSAQSAAFELMRGAGVVAPELAKLERQRERLRYDREESVITSLQDSGKLRPDLNYQKARDIFWMLTGGDVYRMLVGERRWTPEQYGRAHILDGPVFGAWSGTRSVSHGAGRYRQHTAGQGHDRIAAKEFVER